MRKRVRRTTHSLPHPPQLKLPPLSVSTTVTSMITSTTPMSPEPSSGMGSHPDTHTNTVTVFMAHPQDGSTDTFEHFHILQSKDFSLTPCIAVFRSLYKVVVGFMRNSRIENAHLDSNW